MMEDASDSILRSDDQIIRDLTKRIAEIAHDPVMEERRKLWHKHAAFDGDRPMVLAEHGGVQDIIPESRLKCSGERARGIEQGLRHTIFRFEEVGDDHVVEPYVDYNWEVSNDGYGVPYHIERADNEGKMGSYRWDPPIKDLDKDFDKLHPRTFSVDRDATMKKKAELEELWDGILPVRMRGGFWGTMGMTWPAISLIGLEGLMMAMVDNPDGLHRLMAFLRDDHLAEAEFAQREGLLSLNNENDYIGSGSEGYTHELPQPGWEPDQPVRLKDLWVLSESQETVGVSPEMFAEFIFPYQLAVIEKFGLCYYGCCEPVHTRWHVIEKIPNLRRVSVSPWCDQAKLASACGDRVTFCRKPNPTLISTSDFDEDAIRADIRETLEIAKGCTIELSMKDVHTLHDESWRLGRWVELAREEIDKFGY